MNDWYDAEQRVERARELFEQRKWPEALEELRAAVAINPYNSGWLFNIGLTLDEMGRYEEAIDAYREVLEIEADDLESLNLLGTDLSRVGRHREAIAIFARMEKADATHEKSYCNRIFAFTELGDHDSAEQMFYLARMYKEECPHCFYNIGRSLFARELFDKALYCWQKTLDLDDEYPEVHLRMAEAYRKSHKLEQSRQHYLTELRHNPGDTDSLLQLGDLLMELGRLDEAGEKFRRAVEQSPDLPAAYYFHGRWLLGTGKVDEAVYAFSKTLQLDSTYSGAHLHLARVYHARDERDKAHRHLRSEHILLPEDPQILLELANLLIDTDDAHAAIACLKRLTNLEPDNAGGWQNLAVAYFLTSRYVDGIAASEEALRRDPRHLMAMYNLALTYESLADWPSAEQWVRRGLEIAPTDISLRQLEQRLRLAKFKAKVTGFFRALIPSFLRRHSKPAASELLPEIRRDSKPAPANSLLSHADPRGYTEPHE